MKKIQNIVLYSFFLIASQGLYAAILTVNNNNTTVGQYSDLQTAINAATAGDTLLIHRSPTSYGNATITKKLILIGEGALPNKAPLYTTTLGTITLTYNSSTLENASKAKFIGLLINTLTVNEKSTDVNYACDSINILYSKISTISLKNKVYGLSIHNSIINSITNGSLYNCKLTNNFIYTLNASATEGSNNLFLNNIFMFRLYTSGCIIANNAFYINFGGAFNFGCKNSLFSNNIFYGTTNPFTPGDFSANGNTSSNNLFNIDPLFVTPVIFNTLSAYTHTTPAAGPFADFHLQAGSPAKNAGTDGTDIGIYGGSTPWRDGSTADSRYRYFPLPDAVPVITGMTVNNPVVSSGGTLHIQLNATTQP